MLFVLPHGTPMVIRRIDRSMRDWVQRVVPKWTRERITIAISERADKTDEPQHCVRVELDRDVREILPQFDHRRTYIPVDVGEAVLIFGSRYNPASSDLSIVTNGTLSYDFETQDDLAVARDAMLSGDAATGMRIARRALPYGYPIFAALAALEAKQLGKL